MALIPLTPDDPARLGVFRLAGRIGEGGQGVVYLAHAPNGERVAVKVLFRGDGESRARLARELSALESVAPFREGDGGADWAEPVNDCEGRIVLTGVEADELTFALGSGTGRLPGTVWLRRKGNALTYTWKDVPGPGLVTETGDLTRS
ncbi:hypothetical protein ACFQVD_04600 [Streptosporangium amethystogenes subsp. fukuiense]|uniref:Serine/threonine protein kinase n=1 Tax=Streptosporangium amethystogenes subsp. fukuiense TaxID=698418 RepID=A0ABW2STR8_9ACTN